LSQAISTASANRPPTSAKTTNKKYPILWLQFQVLFQQITKVFDYIVLSKYLNIRVGRFLTKKLVWMKVTLKSVHFIVKMSKKGKKMFEVTVGLRKSRDIAVKYLIKVQKFFRAKPWYTLIEAEFNVDFKNTNNTFGSPDSRIHIQNVPSRNDPSQNDPSRNVPSRNDPVTKGPRSRKDPSLKVPSPNGPSHETTQITKRPRSWTRIAYTKHTHTYPKSQNI
jgi:hypothetical protein